MNVTDVSYGPTGRNIGAELRSEPPLMSVPNPKRSVPVNFLDLVEEDSGSLFVEESYVLGSSRSIRSPIMELNPSRDAAKPAPNASSSRTPEIFDTLGKGPVPSLPLEQRPVSRGVIGSARKVRSSASVQEDHFNSTVSAGNDEDLRRLHDDKHLQVRSTVMPLSVAIRSDWESGAGCLQAPISRPGSTPAHCAQNRPPSHGQENSPTYSCGRDVSIQSLTNSAGDLHLGSGGAGGAVRGRDRDYSFGSLLGLAAQPAGGGSPHRHTANESEIIASTPSAALDGSGLHASRGSSRSLHQQQYSVFADAATPDQWLGGAMSKEQAIRGSLSLGGTVSAPPLLNMYSYGYNSLNNTSAFGAASSASSARFDPLAARYEGVLSEQRREQDVAAAAAAPRGVSALPQRSPAPPTPPLSLHEQPTQQRFSAPSPTQQLQQQRLRVEMVAEGESVEGLVLRSCRDILAGAADHSLKAVELANTLRARGEIFPLLSLHFVLWNY